MKSKWKWLCLVPALFLSIGVTGCASTPRSFEYHDDRDEKPGPGLFSGEKGGYIIYGNPTEQITDAEEKLVDSE